MKKFLSIMALVIAIISASSCGARGSKAASDTSVAPCDTTCDTTCVCDSVCACDNWLLFDTVVVE